MNIRLVILGAALLSVVACSNNTQKKAASAKPVGDYFSIDGFIQGQVKQIQSEPYFIYKKMGESLADSAASSVRELRLYSDSFRFPELQSQQKYWYVEQNFGDKANEEYTLNYTAQNDSAVIKYADVVFDDETNAVKRIFLQKMWQQADTSYEQKLYWKTNRYLLLVTISRAPHQEAKAHQVKIVWNE